MRSELQRACTRACLSENCDLIAGCDNYASWINFEIKWEKQNFFLAHQLYRYLQVKYPVPFGQAFEPMHMFEMDTPDNVRHKDIRFAVPNKNTGKAKVKAMICMLYRERRFICSKALSSEDGLQLNICSFWLVRAWVWLYILYKENETLFAIISFWIAIFSLWVAILSG